MTKKHNKKIEVQALSNEEMDYLESLGSFEFHEDEEMMIFVKPTKSLDDYSNLAYQRFEKEFLIYENTSFSITKKFHLTRARLSFFIHSKLVAADSLLKWNDDYCLEPKKIIIKELQEANENIINYKKEIGLKEGVEAEFEFLKNDRFYRPAKQKPLPKLK
ncbi:hypothetical protein ACF8GB_19245 [Pseudomonas sp. xss_4]|uniref:hypothetical protein n=1 Tax=Pseudomonas sp. xss_4 TaxID=3367216 RepID=UPI00370A1FFB